MLKIMTAKIMTRISSNRKDIIFVVAILALAATAAFLSVKLTRPRPFANTLLSDQWQCTRTAGILTVCTRKPG